MSKRNLILLVLTIVATIATAAGIILIKRNQDIREKAAPSSSLYITPATQDAYPGSSVDVAVKLNTSTNLVTGVDIRLKFDPTKLEVVSFTKGSGIPSLNNLIDAETGFDNTTGDLSYVIFTTDRTKAVTGSNIEVLKVTFKVKQTANFGNQAINFGADTSLAAVLEEINVVINKTGAIIRVVPMPTATPTATPSPIPTASPSPTPTSSPSPTPTSSPSPSPTMSPSPTPSPTPRPGDVNGDSAVNIIDIGIMIDFYRVTPVNVACDINNDGQVDIADIGIVIDNYDL
jgi:hypothetical protein